MKALKPLLLGSAGAAALFVAGSVAHAADPMGMETSWKGKEPVWRCDTAAFIEYPGTDTCFKIGGTIATWIAHAEDQVKDGGDFNPTGIKAKSFGSGDKDYHTKADTTVMDTWARLNIDVRRPTEFGVLRGFAEWQVGPGSSINGRHVFIQIGNWLMGYTTPTMHQGYGRPTLFLEAFGVPGDPEAVPRVDQVRYTFDAGNGVQVNLAIQDPATNDGRYQNDLSPSRNEIPDPVANIKVKTSWGGFGVSVGAHQHSLQAASWRPDENQRVWGWGAIAGLDWNVGPNDTLMVQGSYGNGWAGSTDSGAAFEIGHKEHSNSITKTKSWGIVGGWEHQWGGGLSTTIAASHVDNDYDGSDIDGGDEPVNLETTAVWANVIKEVTDGLEVGVEVLWGRNKQRGDTYHGNAFTEDAFGFGAQAVYKFP